MVLLWCRGETRAPSQACSASALRARHCSPAGSEDLEGQRWSQAASLTLASPRVERTEAYENTRGLIIREVHSSAPGGAGLQQPLWHGVLVSPQ